MSNRPKIHATNAINSIRQYRCTNAGVSNYIKISTVVDFKELVPGDNVSNYSKISTVVDILRPFRRLRVSNYIKISTVVDFNTTRDKRRFKLH